MHFGIVKFLHALLAFYSIILLPKQNRLPSPTLSVSSRQLDTVLAAPLYGFVYIYI